MSVFSTCLSGRDPLFGHLVMEKDAGYPMPRIRLKISRYFAVIPAKAGIRVYCGATPGLLLLLEWLRWNGNTGKLVVMNLPYGSAGRNCQLKP